MHFKVGAKFYSCLILRELWLRGNFMLNHSSGLCTLMHNSPVVHVLDDDLSTKFLD